MSSRIERRANSQPTRPTPSNGFQRVATGEMRAPPCRSERVSAVWPDAWSRRSHLRDCRRASNGEIARRAARHDRLRATARLGCECSLLECGATVWLTVAQYLELRSQDRFVLWPGHERDDADLIVDAGVDYLVGMRPPGELYLG
jgi:hypothetical protein